MKEAFDFYTGILAELLSHHFIDISDSVLAVAAGEFDKAVLADIGFSDVVISNMDARMNANSFSPYKWAFQDAEALTFDKESFDFVVVHSGLHHCRVPHQALAEMYRVARKGVLLIESNDSALMKAAARLKLLAEYEIEAVVGNDYKFGGVRNTATPNYVYRWTEREVTKIAQSIDPTGPLVFRYFYSLRLPISRLKMHRNLAVRTLFWLLSKPTQLAASLLKKQGNLFGAFIGKPQTKWPWIDSAGLINEKWARARFLDVAGSQQR